MGLGKKICKMYELKEGDIFTWKSIDYIVVSIHHDLMWYVPVDKKDQKAKFTAHINFTLVEKYL